MGCDVSHVPGGGTGRTKDATVKSLSSWLVVVNENRVHIRGDGVAARCCAHLLGQAGFRVSFEPLNRPRVPVIMLGEAAQALIRDIFGRDHLFRDLPRITKRFVAWGSTAPVELDHSAVIVSEQSLLDSLELASSEAAAPGWTICATHPLPLSAEAHCFGSRTAWPIPVILKSSAHDSACWIESLEDGWLFLNEGWLLAVGANPSELLRKSTLVREQIAHADEAAGSFPASPRMMTPLGGEKWIACGSAALGFDPNLRRWHRSYRSGSHPRRGRDSGGNQRRQYRALAGALRGSVDRGISEAFGELPSVLFFGRQWRLVEGGGEFLG